jgi:hypothetical protein
MTSFDIDSSFVIRLVRGSLAGPVIRHSYHVH